MREILIAGNWKMNKSPKETAEFVAELVKKMGEPACQVAICPPFVCLEQAKQALGNSKIALGAQNCHWEKSGAFTGEVAAETLAQMGVTYILVGHSERRTLFGDTDSTVNARCRSAIGAGCKPVVCVGETLEQREAGETHSHLEKQLTSGLLGITAEEMKNVVIAYEPIWAIGTGKTATSVQAQEACHWVREDIARLYGEETAQSVQILYGGSMNEGNAKELLAQQDIDGGLIGGASLKVEAFTSIVEQGRQ